MIAVVAVLFFAVATIYLIRCRGRWLLNPVPVFVAGQVVMFVGSLPLLEPNRVADQVHAAVMLGALVCFIVGAELANHVWPVVRQSDWRDELTIVEDSAVFSFVFWSLIVVSAAATIAFYMAAGANIFVQSLLSLLASGQRLDDAAGVRESFYAGDRYFAAGYANQFKNILLPLLSVYLTLRYSLRRRRADLVALIILIPGSLVALLGTGQRGAFATFVIIALMFGFAALPKRSGRRFAMTLAIIGVGVFAMATFFLGRGVLASGLVREDNVAGVLLEVWERAFWGNQASSVAGFRYVYDHPMVWGADWYRAFTSLLPRNLFPNKEAPTLALDVFAVLYGSRSGTAPPSMWGTVWYSFGPLGIPIIASLCGVIFHALYARALEGPKLLGRLAVWSAITIVIGVWLVGGPETLLNQGLLALILLSFFLRLRARSRSMEFAGDARPGSVLEAPA